VALYDRATRGFGRVFTPQGIPFIFLHAGAFTQLNGATLDCSNGRFIVHAAA
jgi:hypothetical protein